MVWLRFFRNRWARCGSSLSTCRYLGVARGTTWRWSVIWRVVCAPYALLLVRVRQVARCALTRSGDWGIEIQHVPSALRRSGTSISNEVSACEHHTRWSGALAQLYLYDLLYAHSGTTPSARTLARIVQILAPKSTWKNSVFLTETRNLVQKNTCDWSHSDP